MADREKKAEYEWELIRIEWEKLRNRKPTVVTTEGEDVVNIEYEHIHSDS